MYDNTKIFKKDQDLDFGKESFIPRLNTKSSKGGAKRKMRSKVIHVPKEDGGIPEAFTPKQIANRDKSFDRSIKIRRCQVF